MDFRNHLFIFLSASLAAVLSILFFPASKTTQWLSLKSLKVADLVVMNATIYTSDSSIPFADTMAVRDGRILRVGNYSSVQEVTGHGTKMLNVHGKVVLPGFIDSHVHLLWGGLQMVRVQLQDVHRKDEFIRKVKEAVRDKHQGCWVLGGGWNNNHWGGDLPVTSWIDDVTPNNPVWLSRMDGHMGLANSVALQMAGITNFTKDPVGGTVMKTASGEPTGLLIDSAMSLVVSHIPDVSVDERRDALVRASKHALMRGVTAVVDMGRYVPGAAVKDVWDDFSDVYQRADSEGNMLIRVCLFFPMGTWSLLQDLFDKTGRVFSQWIHLGGVKAFIDGSLGSNSALFYEPYIDEPQNYGLMVTQIDSLYNMTLASDKAGIQVAIHAIGDRANDLVLDMYESVASSNGIRDRRFRIEHSQHLAPGATTRFGQQGVIASVQPKHLLDDADSAAKKLGVERAEKGSYLFKSLLSSNAQLAFGSDWPPGCLARSGNRGGHPGSSSFTFSTCKESKTVADINPLGGIKAAMKRIPPHWDKSWIPSECVTLSDALNAYTISAAHASFLDHELGSLSSGKLADFSVLSVNSWEEFAAEASASVEVTYVGGKQAYP